MTLTEAAELTAKIEKFVILPIGLIMFVWLVMKMINPVSTLPSAYIDPNFLCGPIPKLKIDSLEVAGEITYKCETTAGCYPEDLSKVVNVFRYDHPGQSLFALREAQQTAELLKFDKTKYTRISDTEYKWTDPSTKRTLIIETGNQNISMTTNFSDPTVDTSVGALPNLEKAKEIALQFLQKANLLTKDYSAGEKITHLVQIGPDGSFSEAPSISEADFIRVDFTRSCDMMTLDPKKVEAKELGSSLQTSLIEKDSETITTKSGTQEEVIRIPTRIYNETPYYGNISVLVGGQAESGLQNYAIYGLEYRNWLIPVLPCGTYPLISTREAVRRVQEGEASLVYLVEDGGNTVVPYTTRKIHSMTINKISIGYYDTAQKQKFLQPIYVIEGEATFANGVFGPFTYYVPAVDYDAIPPDAGRVTTEEKNGTDIIEEN